MEDNTQIDLKAPSKNALRRKAKRQAKSLDIPTNNQLDNISSDKSSSSKIVLSDYSAEQLHLIMVRQLNTLINLTVNVSGNQDLINDPVFAHNKQVLDLLFTQYDNLDGLELLLPKTRKILRNAYNKKLDLMTMHQLRSRCANHNDRELMQLFLGGLI
jgi:hypothetical protein